MIEPRASQSLPSRDLNVVLPRVIGLRASPMAAARKIAQPTSAPSMYRPVASVPQNPFPQTVSGAPPVYRPGVAAQAKVTGPGSGGAPSVYRPSVAAQAKMAGPVIGGAPAVYRPNVVAQAKIGGPGIGRAPAVYRPSVAAQAKVAGSGIGGAPAVYRPNVVAQAKVIGSGIGGAPAVYRPSTASVGATGGRGAVSPIATRNARTGNPARTVLQARNNPVPPAKIVSALPTRSVPYAATNRTNTTIQRIGSFDAPPWTGRDDWGLDTDQWSQKEQLLRKVYEVVKLSETHPEELGNVMSSHDLSETVRITPAAQLEKCVELSHGKDAGALATCLYTSYFYGPVNKFLRDRGSLSAVDPAIRELVEGTIESMKTKAVNHTIGKSRRVENKSEWMSLNLPQGETLGVGHELEFTAFTSISRDNNKHALAGMDAANKAGLFGDVTKPALLKFSGTTGLIEPESKYFPEEEEYVVMPGMRARITEVKDAKVAVWDYKKQNWKRTWVPNKVGPGWRSKLVRQTYLHQGKPVPKYKVTIL